MPLSAALIPALSLGVGLGQSIIGGIGSMANKRPDYPIPDSVRQSLSLAKLKFLDPKVEGYDQAKANLDLTTINAITAAKEAGIGQEAIAGVVGQQEAGYRQLAGMNEQSQRQDYNQLQESLSMYSKFEDTQFQLNEFAPYAQKRQLFENMFGGGLENIMGGLDKQLMVDMIGSSTEPDSTAPTTQSSAGMDQEMLNKVLKAIEMAMSIGIR